jgi:putative addiction module killer protein
VYYLARGEELILLLCGGDKSTQESDIEQAKAIAQDFKENEDP